MWLDYAFFTDFCRKGGSRRLETAIPFPDLFKELSGLQTGLDRFHDEREFFVFIMNAVLFQRECSPAVDAS